MSVETLFICKDGTEDAVLGNVALAKACQEAGRNTAVIFTSEALAAVSGGAFAWSRIFAGRDARITISKNAQAQGLPLAAERDSRWTDVRRFIRESASAGLSLWACPVWSVLLGIEEAPAGLSQISKANLVEALTSAKTVVGGY